MSGANSQRGRRAILGAVGASPLIAQSDASAGVPPRGVLPPGRALGVPPNQIPAPPRPRLNLVLGEEVADGWHAAQLVQDRVNFDYYVQSITVRGPFRITRPWRGSPDLATLMPDLSVVSRTLAITWDWIAEPGGSLILPVFVKRTRTLWFRRSRPVKVRLVVKDMTIKGTVVSVKLNSNRIRWTRRVPWAT